MKQLVSYKAGVKRPRSCIDPGDQWTDEADRWTYHGGDRTHIEVHDQEEGEQWEETGLLDLRGDPIYRITRFVRRPIGFVVSDDK